MDTPTVQNFYRRFQSYECMTLEVQSAPSGWANPKTHPAAGIVVRFLLVYKSQLCGAPAIVFVTGYAGE